MSLILVIEDIQRVREHIVEILGFEGFAARGAPDGQSGLELARSLEPDLILCDIGLPDIDGFQVLERLRHDPSSSTIPLIFLTARGDREGVRRGMSMGANDYIVKPFDGTELVAAVRARLEQRATEKRSALGDMHDHLGSLLTDIDLSVRFMERAAPAELPDAGALSELSGLVREAMAAFRDGIATADDLSLVEKNLVDGLHLIVIRRYALFDRQIRYHVHEDPPGVMQAEIGARLARPIFLMIQELLTNDLKHGAGAATLTLTADRQQLEIQFESATRASEYTGRGAGHGIKSITQRVKNLGGTLTAESSAELFAVRIQMPIVVERVHAED